MRSPCVLRLYCLASLDVIGPWRSDEVPIGVNACVCMYMYPSDRKCRLCACTCRYMGRQSYVDACIVHVHVWDREYPFVDVCVHVRTCTCV